MRKRLTATIGIAAVLALLAVQPAMAATEVGNKCVGNASAPNVGLVSLANAPGNPLPAVIPSAGVITRWSYSVTTIPPGILYTTLKLLRPTGVPKQVQVIGESPLSPLVTGTNTFLTRIPVQAGDQILNVGTAEGKVLTVYCKTELGGDRVGVVPGNPPSGSTVAIEAEGEKLQNPIVVFVEPDADKDGFGDETQDLCPQSAAFQIACPIVRLDAFGVSGKGSVTVLVAASNEAPVRIAGTVQLGKGKKATLKAGPKSVPAGKIVRFTLKFPGKLKDALKELEPGKKLTLKIVASATNVAGQVSTDKLNAKLKGQG